MTSSTKSPRNGGSKPSPVQRVPVTSKVIDTELFATSLPGFPGQAKIVVLLRSSQKTDSIHLAILRLGIVALFSKFKIN